MFLLSERQQQGVILEFRNFRGVRSLEDQTSIREIAATSYCEQGAKKEPHGGFLENPSIAFELILVEQETKFQIHQEDDCMHAPLRLEGPGYRLTQHLGHAQQGQQVVVWAFLLDRLAVSAEVAPWRIQKQSMRDYFW